MGLPHRGLRFPRRGHSANAPVTSARPGSPLGAQRTPAAAWPPSGCGHRASGELASRRRGRLGIGDQRGCRDRAGRDPREAGATVPAPPATPGAGEPERRGGAARGPNAAAARRSRPDPSGKRGRVCRRVRCLGKGPPPGVEPGAREAHRRAAPSWSGRAPAPRGRGTRTRWKRGWTITGTSPSRTSSGKAPGKGRARGRPAGEWRAARARARSPVALSPPLAVPQPRLLGLGSGSRSPDL